jgi:hypothetical protein
MGLGSQLIVTEAVMTKRATKAAGKARPARTKKPVQKKKAKARWREDAVIHQDVFFAEAPMEQ